MANRQVSVQTAPAHPHAHVPQNPIQQTHKERRAQDPNVAAWGPVAALAGTIVLYFVAQIIGGFLVSIYPRLRGWPYDQRLDWLTNTIVGQFWYVLVVELLTVAGVLWYVKRRQGTIAQLGLTRPRFIDVGYAIVGLVVYYVILIAVLQLIVARFFPGINLDQQQDIGFKSVVGGRDLWLTFISLVVFPPIVEEIVFRGFLFNGLKKGMPVIAAGLLTSALFASAHLIEGDGGSLFWIGGIDTFILSSVLVYVRQKSGRLYGGILIHAAKNAIAFVTIYHVGALIRLIH